MGKMGVLKLQLSRGDSPGELNRSGNHECITNPTPQLCGFLQPSAKGQVKQAGSRA